MTRSKFLELVSAYIDGEISQNEEVLLRAEVRRRPERALVLASYERMNMAAKAARFPLRTETLHGKPSRAVTFFWFLSGAAVCAVVALAIMAAVGGSSSTPGIEERQDYCVLSGNFAVNEDNSARPAAYCASRVEPCVPDQFAPVAIHLLFAEARTCAANPFKDFSIQPAYRTTIQEPEIFQREKLHEALPQGMGALCVPALYNQ